MFSFKFKFFSFKFSCFCLFLFFRLVYESLYLFSSLCFARFFFSSSFSFLIVSFSSSSFITSSLVKTLADFFGFLIVCGVTGRSKMSTNLGEISPAFTRGCVAALCTLLMVAELGEWSVGQRQTREMPRRVQWMMMLCLILFLALRVSVFEITRLV